ncbi:MAG: hypothetical protein ABIR70_17845 [Bryobacteraceae bacterium]
MILKGPLFFIMCVAALAQSYEVRTIAGFGLYGGDNGPATAALLTPGAVAVDSAGNVFVADPGNYRIRKINPGGTVTTVIGKGYGGFSGDGGPASDGGMSTTESVAVDSTGNLYFSDDANWRIREVTTAGTVKTVAGNGVCGTPVAGMAATQAPLCDVDSVAVDLQGRVYFASADQIWMIAGDGTLTLVAGLKGGTGNTGDGGAATAAQIGYPGSMTIDSTGNLYFADQYNFVIREITGDKMIRLVTTITDVNASTISLAADAAGGLYYGTGTRTIWKLAGFAGVAAATLAPTYDASFIALDKSGNIYASSTYNLRLLKVTNGTSTTIAGAIPGGSDALPAPATSVRLHLTAVDSGIAVDAEGNVYFAELDNNLFQRIDKVTPTGTMSAMQTPLKFPNGIDFTAGAVAFSPAGVLHFSTFSQVYRLEANGSVTLVAGANGFPTNLGDGGPAVAAKITSPVGLAFDSLGNLYIAEAFSSRVRKVTPQGVISTFAGTGFAGYSGDGGLPTLAKLAAPVDVEVDSAGNVYIADVSAAVVRKVAPNGIITTVAGNGTHGFSGDGGLATKAMLSGAAAIALDPSGNLFIADRSQAGGTFIATPDNNRIRMVNTNGIISTISGSFPGYNGEGLLSSSAASGGPVALATDARGNLYVAEASTERVRVLTAQPAASSVVISSVNTAGGSPDVSQNDWIEIKGVNLAPASVGAAGMVWSSAPEFLTGKMPTELSNVSVTVNGKSAFVYFISAGQINVLTPLDNSTGSLTIVVNNNGVSSAPYAVNVKTSSASFLRFGATNYIAATHADTNASLLGPTSISVPGYAFTPARPSETIVLYAVGFGLPVATLVNGSSSQFGVLPTLPVVQIGGTAAQVTFAGIISPGLTQINVVIPTSAANGDNTVTASYGGGTTPIGSSIAVLR